jgi:3-isopropylmalate/(R)-2-methylmalate dehydratase small subunit
VRGVSSIRGRIWKFGDHVDTDAIIPVRYCNTFLKEELGPYAMSGLDPAFAEKVSPGDILVAGSNFGCGSSRENAPLALLGAGVGAVVAASFGRIFFRNAINVGLPFFESPEAAAACVQGDVFLILPLEGRIENESTGHSYAFAPYPDKVAEIIACGGLVPYVRARLLEKQSR